MTKQIPRLVLRLRTLGELLKHRSRASVMSFIRRDARITLEECDDPQKCMVCSYNTVLHCCHVVDIRHWEDWATIAEINDPINLIWLCPNHHAEYDLGLLDIYAYCPHCSITNKG